MKIAITILKIKIRNCPLLETSLKTLPTLIKILKKTLRKWTLNLVWKFREKYRPPEPSNPTVNLLILCMMRSRVNIVTQIFFLLPVLITDLFAAEVKIYWSPRNSSLDQPAYNPNPNLSPTMKKMLRSYAKVLTIWLKSKNHQ